MTTCDPCLFCGTDDPDIHPTDDGRTVEGGCRNPDCILFEAFPGTYRDADHFADWWNVRSPEYTAQLEALGVSGQLVAACLDDGPAAASTLALAGRLRKMLDDLRSVDPVTARILRDGAAA